MYVQFGSLSLRDGRDASSVFVFLKTHLLQSLDDDNLASGKFDTFSTNCSRRQ